MKDIFVKINLQLFAEAGNVVNTLTNGYVNAYTGEKTPFDSTNTLAGELKTFYDTELLENARVDMIYGQFGKKQKLPARHGKTVEWRKWNAFAKADKLQEGVIPSGQKFGSSSKTGVIEQYGTFCAISDTLELRAYDDVIIGATEEMGASASSTSESLITAALLTNTNVLYCDNVDLATGKATPISTSGDGSPCKLMEANNANLAFLSSRMVAKAAAKLKRDKVPTIDGMYVAVVHPSVALHLRVDDKLWQDAHTYSATTELFRGELGSLHGVRFVESADAPVLNDAEYLNADDAPTYATYFFGKDAFGTIDPEGGALEMIIKDKSQAGGPLNQFSTVGYKFETNGATILYTERVLRVMSCTQSGNEDII